MPPVDHEVAVLQQSSGGNGVGQNPYAFKSGIQDRATGFVKFGARWYNPVTGTWTQQDTLDAPLDTANANRYSYAGDDPINEADPSGRVTIKCLIDIAEAGASAQDEIDDIALLLAGVAGDEMGLGK